MINHHAFSADLAASRQAALIAAAEQARLVREATSTAGAPTKPTRVGGVLAGLLRRRPAATRPATTRPAVSV